MAVRKQRLSEWQEELRGEFTEPPTIDTLRRWCKDGRVPAWQSPTGRWYRLVDDVDTPTGDAVVDKILGVG